MFAATSQERSCKVASQTRVDDMTGSGVEVKKRAHSPEVTLPPLCPKPPPPSAASVTEEPFSRTPVLHIAPSDRPVSVVELPPLIAQVGPGRAVGGAKCTDGPRLMGPLGTDIPNTTAAELTAQSLIMTVNHQKASKPNAAPLTGLDVVQIFAQEIHLAELELYYLKEVDQNSYRPYDLQVVHFSEAGSEHYIFSPNSVLHVTESGYGGVISLTAWCRESVLWTALQEIPFFRDFRLLKAFTRWHRNVRKILFQRRRVNLQDRLLVAVPQFRAALHVFTRVIEELKETHWLPQEDSQTYTLLEFKNALMSKNQERLQILQKLSQCRPVILNMVRESSYRSHQELQLHMEYAKRPNKSHEPIHLHLAHQRELKRALAWCEGVLQRLGSFAHLVNQMTVQSLVTVVTRDVSSLLSRVLKRDKSQRCALFHAELSVADRSQLTVDPPVRLFQEAVSEALLTAADSIIQMCDTCGFFLEMSNAAFSSDVTEDVISDLSCVGQSAVTGEIKNSDEMTGRRKFCCWQWLRDLSAQRLVLEKPTLQGNAVHGCFYPLSNTQLKWQISINDFSRQAEREQAEIMQEAEQEIQQLCESFEWLLDLNLFVSQPSRAAADSLKGQSAVRYEEHVEKIRHWAERINTVPSSFSTSNQLFTICCSRTKETLGRQLRLMEEEVLEQLTEQMELHSDSLISDLERATAELKAEPQDLQRLSKYALTVRESVKLLPDMQTRLEYVCSLKNTICIKYRKMNEQELTLEEKMLGLWDGFIPLLREADSIVRRRLPPAADALDTMFSFLVCDLKKMISRATCGPFLDPNQNAQEMVSQLNNVCAHVHNLNAKLEQLSRNSENLRDRTMDLTALTMDIQKVNARKALWELRAVYTTWMDEWKQLLFSEAVVPQAQEKTGGWKEEALSLSGAVAADDALLQDTLRILESLSHQLAVMARLQSPTLTHKHRRAVFEGLGLVYVPELTVAEVMSQQLEIHQTLINKICRDAEAERDMLQNFKKLRQGWEGRLFQLDVFTHPVRPTERPREDIASNLQTAGQRSCIDAGVIIIGLDTLSAEVGNDVMTLSTMIKSPHSLEFRQLMEEWVQSLQDLEKLLDLFERYQQMWAFLTKIFTETSFSVQRVDLLEQFKPVDETFKEILRTLLADSHVLNFVHYKKTNDRFHGESLGQILTDGLSTMEAVSNQMEDVLDALRQQFPRLWFLSDREVMQLLSLHPTPVNLLPTVCKCFKGVRWLEVESACNTRDVKKGATSGSRGHAKVLGVFSNLQEHITFLSPLEPNLDALAWLSVFEKQLKLTMVQLIKQCAVVQNQLQPSAEDLGCDVVSWTKNIIPAPDLLSESPLQCLLVVEEAAWCSLVLQAFRASSPVKLSHVKAHNSAKLKTLGRAVREGATGAESLLSKYRMTCLRALVQLAMNHAQQLSQITAAQCEPESSFEWLSLMKYHLNLTGPDGPACHVDVLGHRIRYGYEYFGPEGWVMAHAPSTDRAALGVLLALTSYRCGFVSGASMSGKKRTAVQLGRALGRQVVVMQCYPSTRPGVVQRLLFGALQTGAWLLLDSVDLLTQGVQSSLGQHLMEIQQAFRTCDGVTGCTNTAEPACHMVVGGRSVSANLSYGCVLVSPMGYASEVPEILRFATRPVALTRPDYRIIAEVMLTSIGFSDAVSLSRRLVSLISVAEDSRCLPDFITRDQSCHLVVLQKIISAAETHLKQSVRQREISDEAKGSAADTPDLASSQTEPAGVAVQDRKECKKPSRLHPCHSSIVEGLMEETAIVKAILSVLFPVCYDNKKASQFSSILKDEFPIACQFPLFQQYMEEEEKNQLKEAVTEELQRMGLQSDTEIAGSALTLYQTMKSSQAVLLVGPPASRKTTCYRALAGALSSLAARAVFENDGVIEGEPPQAAPRSSASHWSSVDAVVLFPNAMSHDEAFGYFCTNRGWQDGAVPKVLREGQEHTGSDLCDDKEKRDRTPAVKWLVLDGEPVGRPGWLDHLTTACDPEDPCLFLSSGETLVPSRSHFKLLMEVTDLREASPSAVTRCSLVHLAGADLWKAALKTEMSALCCERRPDGGTLKMWNCLAQDLFSSTLGSLRQKALTSAVHSKAESCTSPTYGLREITSFAQILRALLQHFGKEVEKVTPAGRDAHCEQAPLARNLFLVAYIWGFGGHLHPCHWPQFDLLVRQVLFNCRYKIAVPDEESVFEHFFRIDGKMWPENTLLTNYVTPKYGKYTCLLSLMLEAKQPVLLAGEPGSGKSSLCQALLSVDKPHVVLPASPLLRSTDLRTILKTASCQARCTDAAGSATKPPSLLLFVDDLHDAPCDAFGKTSTALESLRQSMSAGGILTFDSYSFKLLSSRTVSYMATCSVSGLADHHSHVISSRLSRLFSIFVLPSLSVDVILSIHSPRLQVWLDTMPLRQSGKDMARCIIAATQSLLGAVRDHFQPSAQRPDFTFSHHDLQKVFQGMCLWRPDTPNTAATQETDHTLPGLPEASHLNVVRLWMHECVRTFSDRLRSEDETKTLAALIAEAAATHYAIRPADGPHPDSTGAPPTAAGPAGHTRPPDTAGSCEKTCRNTDTQSQCIYPLHPQGLQCMEDIAARLVYGPELSEDRQHDFKRSSYREQDLDELLQKLSALNDRGHKVDNNSNVTSRYILHRQRASQLLHILRALLIPGGHGVLIGSDRGTGRRTTARLAARLTGHQLLEVHAGNENKLHHILKEAGNGARQDGGRVMVLVHEEISESVREELLVAMACRTYPALCTDEELRNLVSRATAVRKSRRYHMDSWVFDKYLSHIHENVHVFLLMSFTTSNTADARANGGIHGNNRQMSKAMSLSCCVEVYQPWSSQSLVEAAAQCLKTCPHVVKRDGSEVGLAAAMAGIHQSACRYASVLLAAQPFSPHTYLEFIAHFTYLCSHLQEQWRGPAGRAACVLSRLDVLNNRVVQCTQRLRRLREMVAATQQREEMLLRAVDDHKMLLEEAQKKYWEEKNTLYHLEEQINQAQKQVRPAFLSGLKILQCLNPSDLEEVRRYRDPPDGVVKIMDALCLLFNRSPGWESAKQLLGQSNFFQELEFFDQHSLTNEQLLQLGQIVRSPQFEPESVREVSKACESLCRWVRAVHECCRLQRQLSLKRQLEALDKEARGRLRLAERREEDARRRLEDLKLQLRSARDDLEEQLVELREAESMERDATAARLQLETHCRGWRPAALEEAELHEQNLLGDALILAAVIAYLGPFAPDVRAELLSKWRELCQTGRIDTNPQDPRASLFTQPDPAPPRRARGFPVPASQRLQLSAGRALGVKEQQLPDSLSAGLVVRLLLWGHRSATVRRRPLLADAQQHQEMSAHSWLLTGQRAKLEAECRMIVCADDPELLDKLDRAAEKGVEVLVTHVERAVPSPQFLAWLAPPAGCGLPGLNQQVQPTHPEFCLLLSTHLPVRLLSSGIHPSILARVHVVDLSLSSGEIQELMLTQLLQSECKDLLTQHRRLQNDKQLLQEQQAAEQAALMDDILRSDASSLQDSDFHPRVAVRQEAMKRLQAEIQQLTEELDHHEALVTAPRQLVRLAAALYRALQEVSRLSPAYNFSLRGFVTVMQDIFIVRPLVSYAGTKVPDCVVPEITNKMVSQLLVHYRPRLFKDHAAVLKLLVSAALLQHHRLCSEGERLAFLRGLQDAERPVSKATRQTAAPLPSWIPPHIHPELVCVEEVPAFRGLIASLAASPVQWREYLRFPSATVVGPVPCRSHAHLTLLQRALLWKTLLPNSLEGLAQTMADCHLCLPELSPGSAAPHAGNPESLSRYLVKHEGPVILTSPSARGDNWTSIQPLYLINKLADCVAQPKQVQVRVVSFGALCDGQAVLSALDRAVLDGHWLVFDSCHLLDCWDDKVVARLSQLTCSFKEQRGRSRPCFRLWFTTQECAVHHIPAAVRLCALTLVCDSPWDLKEELSCSQQQAASVLQRRSPSGTTADDTEILHRCAVFHSVLLQRQAYKYLGQGRMYSWSEEDLQVLVDAHYRIGSLCCDKTKALQCVAVQLVHGAHVTDSADLEVVESVARTCLSRATPPWGSGVFSNIISSPGQSGRLQIGEQGLQDPASTSGPPALGFGGDVAAEIIKINSCSLNVLLQASQNPLGAARSFSTQLNQPSIMPAYGHARDRLQALQARLEATLPRGPDAGAVSHPSLCDFLQAEWDALVDSVSSLLSQLRQSAQYSAPTSASLLQFTDLSRLERRAELLGSYTWHRGTSDPPGVYRLSAFTNARGFLVALKRDAAKLNRKYISDIKLHFQVLSDSAASCPLDDVYLCGLELRGASWDSQIGAIRDTDSLQPRSLPLVCVKAQVRSANTGRDTFPCKSSDLKATSDAPPSPAPPQLVYHCPLYIHEERGTGDRGLADVNVIAKLPLHARLSPVLCSLRRVRLVSTL